MMRAESGLYFYQQVINQWSRDSASVVGAMVICGHVISVTLSRTPSWNGWHNIYRAAHQLNLLEPGVVLLVNRVPHFLQTTSISTHSAEDAKSVLHIDSA